MQSADGAPQPQAEQVALAKWHIDRYDRLRASTASRASVVLSAGALLSAGNAVILVQLLGGWGNAWLIAAFSLGLAVSGCLVVASLIAAAGVLVTVKDSRTLFAGGAELPPAPIFNGSYTARHLALFQDFRSAVLAQDTASVLQAAHVELWVVIRQHRHRYDRLRRAVRTLRWAALVFLAVFLGLLINNLISRL
ncbi:hypothetical protein [Kibdelosporangium phytohabitans]|uniref:Uncharacterized protein n=1 Tax=Kibdelosporangium phytohabitans TaxID=860235 RepID=A0A0N7F461_9PSEU|nr:hypothetical protein [Kibdelosporangium phytohabitans]ALG10535.1 hypothetical protein AOZ06_29835 [Kibdelosporangium phytohabitans]MBE1461633.1 hypothetical protein [Kibdelosporangium phytohabitans]